MFSTVVGGYACLKKMSLTFTLSGTLSFCLLSLTAIYEGWVGDTQDTSQGVFMDQPESQIWQAGKRAVVSRRDRRPLGRRQPSSAGICPLLGSLSARGHFSHLGFSEALTLASLLLTGGF